MRFRFALATALFLTFTSFSAFAEATDEVTLARLDTHLDKIRQEFKFGRELGGGLWIGLGAVTAIGGTALAYATLTDPALENTRNTFTAVSLGFGAADVATGALILALKSENETMPEKFQAAPESTPEERARKVAIGEVSLESLANKAQFGRLLGSGLLGVIGGATLLSGYSSNAAGPPGGVSGSNRSSLYSGIFYLGYAVVNLLIETTPEREHHAYERWKTSSGSN